MQYDITISKSMTTIGFTPNTERAHEWMLARLDHEREQWHGGTLFVPLQFASDVWHALKEAGFSISEL